MFVARDHTMDLLRKLLQHPNTTGLHLRGQLEWLILIFPFTI
jgi:hypothetical protein